MVGGQHPGTDLEESFIRAGAGGVWVRRAGRDSSLLAGRGGSSS